MVVGYRFGACYSDVGGGRLHRTHIWMGEMIFDHRFRTGFCTMLCLLLLVVVGSWPL